MRKLLMIAACGALAACASNAPHVIAAPAQAGALDCAMRTMAGLGYNPIQGGVADGYIKFDRFRGTNTGQRAAAALPGVGRPTDGDYVLVSTAANTFRVSVSAYKMINGATRTYGPSSEAVGHGEMLVATCANPANPAAGQPPSR
jgi:hypothetical protein